MTATDTGHPYDIAAHILSALRQRGWIETHPPAAPPRTAPKPVTRPPTRNVYHTAVRMRVGRYMRSGQSQVTVFVSAALDAQMGRPLRYDLERVGDALYLRAVSAGGYACARRGGCRFVCIGAAGLLEGMSGHYGVGADGRVG